MKVPKGWLIKKFIDFAPLQRGFDLTSDMIVKGNYPVVYSNGIRNRHNEYKVKGPGIVTGRSGTIGKVTYVNEDFWPHNTSLWVTDFKKNLPKFVYYAFLNFKLEKYLAGSGVPTLNRNDIHRTNILVPPLNEQKTIADILSTWDQVIDKTEKLIELKEKKLKILIRKLLKKAHENQTTEYQTLGSILKYEQPTKYIVSCTDYDKNNGIPVLTANKGFILGYTNETSNVFEKNLPAIIFDDFTTDSKFVDFPFKVKSSAMKILYPVSQDYDSLYIFLAMTEIDVLLGGHKRYWLSEYQFYEIPVPNYETQKELSNIYKLQLEEIKALNKLLQNYKSQKQGLMQKLLTGEWKVKI